MKLRVVARVRRAHEPKTQQREEHERAAPDLLDHVRLELGRYFDLDHGWWWGASTLRGDPGVLMIAAARWCGADATLRRGDCGGCGDWRFDDRCGAGAAVSSDGWEFVVRATIAAAQRALEKCKIWAAQTYCGTSCCDLRQ